MGRKAILNLELPDATDSQKMVFHLVLADRAWTPIDRRGDGWQASIARAVDRDQVKGAVWSQLEEAARAAGNITYLASVRLQSGRPARFHLQNTATA